MSAGNLHELIDLVIDGVATDEEIQDLARLVDEHPELSDGLIRELLIHSLLSWSSEDISVELATFGAIAASEAGRAQGSTNLEALNPASRTDLT
jgi:hypothetical protein